ncbi:hypothetical protein RJ639_041234 [Escallonia herrerae]|uniref:Calcium-transporting ATPase n=1 Tax=Escallonia herrerae TaxID=1293975 RepID=A0AA88WRE4_9ASTE|nr:hypothetical protein RJ639_041234 [Escallonia herrerae]
MSEDFKGSPYRRHRNDDDLETGSGHSASGFHGGGGDNDDDGNSGPFDIVRTKSASLDRLKRWRQAALVLNASRRFRYTLDLKKEEEKKQIIAKIRTHAQVIRVRGLAEKLKTNMEKGVHADEADLSQRKNIYGSNTYPRKEGRSFWRFLLDACRDTTLIILMVAASASLALGIKTEGIKEGWYDGASIALAVIIVIAVTAISDYKQSLQFQGLNEEKQNIQLEIVRGGRRVRASIFDIVVGDVVPLKIGDQIPADGVLISGHSLAIDESSMTGESKIVRKDAKAPFLMSGCKVADGYGTMLVTSVGINTEWGLLMSSISEDNGEETPLQVRLNGVATFIGIVGLVIAVSVLIILVARYFTGHTLNPDGNKQFNAGKTKLSDAINGAVKIFTVAVTIVVVAVPEGLPLAVTLTLAFSMRKMMADKALVRRLSACETMGSATTICSDKTGTLTLNLMTVVEAHVCGKKIDPPDNRSLFPPEVASLLIEGIAQNTTGSVFMPEGGSAVEVSGSPTEKAILQWGVDLGMNFEAIRSDSSIIHAFPFNSEKKRGGVALKLADSEVHIHWKGAAELVLASCTSYFDANGGVVQMDTEKVLAFKKAIEDMAARSLRCVAFAYTSCKAENVPTVEEELANWELPENDLILLAIAGLKDPCRTGVKDAVQLCQKAGVKVRMVTGDNLQTARAIALECGILVSDADSTEPNLIEGKAFRALSEAQRLEVADKISVMGRSSPNDKLLLVQALRKRGHVVGVTGDGTNDAPALHEALGSRQVGIRSRVYLKPYLPRILRRSMKSDVKTDSFPIKVQEIRLYQGLGGVGTMVVRWGRSVYANIQKFIQFQLTVNVAAITINVVAAISSGDVPLNTVQLLWVNLIMDTLGALALATEPPTDHLMERPPVGRREPLVTNVMWRNLLVQALYQVTVLLVLNFAGRSLLNLEDDNDDHAIKVKNTLIFNAFVLCQVFNEFNARKPDEFNVFKGVTKNHLFMGIVGMTLVFQFVLIFFLGKFTSSVKLSWKLWLVSVAIGVISWPLAMIGKLIPVPERPFSEFFKRKSRRSSRGKKPLLVDWPQGSNGLSVRNVVFSLRLRQYLGQWYITVEYLGLVPHCVWQ